MAAGAVWNRCLSRLIALLNPEALPCSHDVFADFRLLPAGHMSSPLVMTGTSFLIKVTAAKDS